jgi:putative FmdB family regulatory protein
MPIFAYHCESCDETTKVMHLIGEDLSVCPKCDASDTLIKLLNKPFVTKSKGPTSPQTGELTKKFIEENRKVLEQQKKEIKEKTHDNS